MKPQQLPSVPLFSSGPCAKRPGWANDVLSGAALGRSHRSKIGKAKLCEVINRSRNILGIPDNYLVGIVPASDTGAMEMVLWSMLGSRGIVMLAWESFGACWVNDVTNQLKLNNVQVMEAPYGQIVNLAEVDFSRDVVFTWNGTTSGVRVPDGDWILANRSGLTICDATSAVFAMDLAWEKLDVVTWSWQKVLGGEGAHGMLAMSPRAIDRLVSYVPPWPIPKLFRIVNGGKLNKGIFVGETINTPSMLAVEDAIDTLTWAEKIGGLITLINRCEANLAVIEHWVANSDWVSFLANDKSIRSCTSICLSIVDPAFLALSYFNQAIIAKNIAKLVEDEGAGYDIASHRDAPPGLRIWGGATVETQDINALLPWLDWAWGKVKPKITNFT
ncbi:phosphoserine aminotransferase [Candidatus Endolissoclinum faulkneri L5]|uniref:phosphoserine transaminase n=1 Tax=Candidatus Endolissoclinum faulkneri L5 TaxID=1401328 RepID=V9TTE4_9PROT|nr:phosphoserine transaminase [Candidatus Endolissoclinum faulkneri]AHC73432.1 phosphoserine aminotransferase [Candidatus Endolissoclinum faulkneri L5]